MKYLRYNWLTFKTSKNLKRIVVLSSNAAVTRGDETGRITEENWNTKNPGEIQELGRNASQMAKYRTSKTLAERGMCLNLFSQDCWLMRTNSGLGFVQQE